MNVYRATFEFLKQGYVDCEQGRDDTSTHLSTYKIISLSTILILMAFNYLVLLLVPAPYK